MLYSKADCALLDIVQCSVHICKAECFVNVCNGI